MEILNFASYGVRDDQGGFDIDATVSKFRTQFTSWTELQAATTDKIDGALDTLYSENPTLAGNKPAIVSLVLAQIGLSPKNVDSYNELRARVEESIDSNPRFYVVKGAGGGLRRQTDTEWAHFQATGMNPIDVAKAAKEAKKSSK